MTEKFCSNVYSSGTATWSGGKLQLSAEYRNALAIYFAKFETRKIEKNAFGSN